MKLTHRMPPWITRSSTLILLIVPLLLTVLITTMFGSVLFERIVTIFFVHLILVVGLQIFMGNSGILSFAHVGFMGIGAFASVLFSMSPQAKAIAIPDLYALLLPIQLPFLPALLIGAGLAALLAALVGYPLMRLSDAAAVITSFALLNIIHVVLVHWKQLTNGPRTLFGVDPYTTLWNSAVWSIVMIILAYWFKESAWGLQLRASRDDRYAAAAVGINLVAARAIAFSLSAFVAALAGGLWAHFITSFSPANFYLPTTFLILSMLVIGGPGSVSGAVVGTVIVTIVFEGLRAVENAINSNPAMPTQLIGFTEIFLATVMIVILIWRPGGIMGGQELRWPRSTSGLGAMPTQTDQALPAKGG